MRLTGYSGDWLIRTVGFWNPDIKLAIDTILNFLKYIQHHDVCPEYADNIAEASRICSIASKEIPELGAIGAAVPGDFNLACRILFCNTGSMPEDDGHFLCKENTPDYVETPRSTWDSSFVVPKDFDAERVFKTTISIHEPGMIERVL